VRVHGLARVRARVRVRVGVTVGVRVRVRLKVRLRLRRRLKVRVGVRVHDLHAARDACEQCDDRGVRGEAALAHLVFRVGLGL
jgi:hypothetical protein